MIVIDGLRRIAKMAVLHVLHRVDKSQRRRLYEGRGSVPLHHWGVSANDRGHLLIGGCDAIDLAERYGTPLHVVDEASLVRTFTAFRDAFLRHYPKVEIGYSYKTNPLPGVLKILHRAGASAEVISHFELSLALTLRMPGDRIIFNGPPKTEEALPLPWSIGAQLLKLYNIPHLHPIPNLLQLHL